MLKTTSVTLSLTARVMTNISFKYLVPKALADKARFVKEAKIAKKVAFKCAGAFLQSKLIMESSKLVLKATLTPY